MMKIALAITMLLLSVGCSEKTANPEAPKSPSNEPTMDRPNPGQSPAAPKAGAEVVCNLFDLRVELQANTLRVSLDTDLPDTAEVAVSVSRSYLEKGNTSRYSIDYFSEKSTVLKWKSPLEIPLDNAKWLKALNDKQDQLSRSGIGFEVEALLPSIRVNALLPVNQSDPCFGDGNSNLSGKAVPSKGIRVVESTSELAFPIDSKLALKKKPSLDPQNLDLGNLPRMGVLVRG